jgi:hypothetical protein
VSKDKESDTISTISGATDPQKPQQQIQLQIDDSQTPTNYCSTARVWGSAEEINLDFAGPVRATNDAKVARLKIDQRIVLNPWAAKRLALALGQAVARYEQTYGTLELEERKRRVGGAVAAPNPAGSPA